MCMFGTLHVVHIKSNLHAAHILGYGQFVICICLYVLYVHFVTFLLKFKTNILKKSHQPKDMTWI